MGWFGIGNPQPGHTKGGAGGSNSIPMAVAKSNHSPKKNKQVKPVKSK